MGATPPPMLPRVCHRCGEPINDTWSYATWTVVDGHHVYHMGCDVDPPRESLEDSPPRKIAPPPEIWAVLAVLLAALTVYAIST